MKHTSLNSLLERLPTIIVLPLGLIVLIAFTIAWSGLVMFELFAWGTLKQKINYILDRWNAT